MPKNTKTEVYIDFNSVSYSHRGNLYLLSIPFSFNHNENNKDDIIHLLETAIGEEIKTTMEQGEYHYTSPLPQCKSTKEISDKTHGYIEIPYDDEKGLEITNKALSNLQIKLIDQEIVELEQKTSSFKTNTINTLKDMCDRDQNPDAFTFAPKNKLHSPSLESLCEMGVALRAGGFNHLVI